MIFETHAHYEDKKYDEDREKIIAAFADDGIGAAVNVGSDLKTSELSIALAEKYPKIYAAIGAHPTEVGCLSEAGMDWLRQQTTREKVVAIGEIGLDYYCDKDGDVQKKQREWFWKQLLLAAETNLPVIIHSRDAAEDTMTILKEFQKKYPGISQPGVIHCYSYSPEMAKEFINMGYFIGVGGVVTFKNAKKLGETVKTIPLDRIVVETDCPYMAPEPHRGERNASRYLPYVIEKIAQIKEVPPNEVEERTADNARILYRL